MLMRYVRILFIHLQDVFQSRLRVFIWFLIPVIEASILLFFWKGPLTKTASIAGWNYGELASYYIFLIIASSFIVCHIEEDVSKRDIKDGNLVNYVMRPFSYFWMKFFLEIPWRILQGAYGCILAVTIFLFAPSLFVFVNTLDGVLFSILIVIFALFLSFLYKMILGLIAFWLIDTSGIYEFLEIFYALLGGLILPLALMPNWLAQIASYSPFAYITYFPVIAFQGKLQTSELLHVLYMQGFWICFFGVLYQVLWNLGIKKFNTVGQ